MLEFQFCGRILPSHELHCSPLLRYA
ncbi:hypothetical protein F383_13319 [Gossypium arboreum]|uniref:Uncharacterized protein n=1 Tax=Gossypium arboreum TaxID=29729 RepID=A0A0B0NKD6_GOSAR|nr:hypothetical protein F383_13319 [Gossypium arboreum]